MYVFITEGTGGTEERSDRHVAAAAEAEGPERGGAQTDLGTATADPGPASNHLIGRFHQFFYNHYFYNNYSEAPF